MAGVHSKFVQKFVVYTHVSLLCIVCRKHVVKRTSMCVQYENIRFTWITLVSVWYVYSVSCHVCAYCICILHSYSTNCCLRRAHQWYKLQGECVRSIQSANLANLKIERANLPIDRLVCKSTNCAAQSSSCLGICLICKSC